MTYRDLMTRLSQMTEEQLSADVTIVDISRDEAFGHVTLSVADQHTADAVGLDLNHVILCVELGTW